ncbi:kinase-like protein [Diplodia corticola]|uniref:non-specific serine/threonine protein kinase n=1 Tax=Diplodia corticola TaxID=236234 RepID=A0A1J9RBE7_9PEZI|nr:kinase-like protein [Diplodia corticola]OJD37474.1 kinase-like protein [Diplodia corticola]
MAPKRALTQNARNAYIEDKFPEEARRRNLDPKTLWAKRKKDTRRERIVKHCSKSFPSLSTQRKKWYQYQVEKKWPLWFERPNAVVDLQHLDPGPEWVVQYELDHFSQDKKGDPKRNQWLKKHRQNPDDMPAARKAHLEQTRNMILRARAKLQPFTPGAPAVPGNDTVTRPLPDDDMQDDDRSVLASSLWVCHKVLYDMRACQVLIYRRHDADNKTTDRYTVEYKNDHLRPDPETKGIMKTIAMGWAPHGNLAELIDHYDTSKDMIPEPFVWYCFRAVTENALVCWNGHTGRDMVPGWEHIVNCDIKADNVFLGEPDPNEPMVWARRYPQPKIGDFGASYITRSGLDDTGHPMPYRRRVNPPDFRGYGTPGSMAPEAMPHQLDQLTHARYEASRAPYIGRRLATELHGADATVHSWTMVWEIGMLMWCMLSNNSYGGVNTQQTEIVVDFSDSAGGRDLPARRTMRGASMRPAYSGRLVELVYQCLAFRPQDRIGLADLWDQVVEGCNDTAALFDGLQTAPPPNGPNGVSFVPDKYPVGENVLNDTG